MTVRVVPIRFTDILTGPLVPLSSLVSAKNVAEVGVAVAKAFSPLAVVHAASPGVAVGAGHEATPSWVYSVRISDARSTWFVTAKVFWTSALWV